MATLLHVPRAALLGTVCLLAAGLTAGPAAAQQTAPAPAAAGAAGSDPASDPATLSRNFSYILGVQTGNNLRRQLPRAIHDLDLDAMMRGIRDRLEGREPDMDVAEMTFWSGRFLEMVEERSRQRGVENLGRGETFRAEYAARDGVRSTASGMLYRELAAGDGAQPGIGQSVRVHYRGTLIDGREFDSSIARGEPVSLQLRKVIPGWQEALTMMQEGDRWEVVLPPDLAYGAGGAGEVGPNETLVFEIHLLQVE